MRPLGRHEFEGAFDPETVDALAEALDLSLRLYEADDRFRQIPRDTAMKILAKGVINIAKSGVQDSSALAEGALSYLLRLPA